MPTSKLNIESAEYANIVASIERFYDSGRRARHAAAAAGDEALLRRWMTRVLAGYWTHGGYLNWDTGFSFGRWHQMKKFALAQQALIGIAAGGRLSPSHNEASWAKHILEAGFALYERKLPRARAWRPGLFYPLKPKPQSNAQALLSASRIVANAARAVSAGSRRVPAPRRRAGCSDFVEEVRDAATRRSRAPRAPPSSSTPTRTRRRSPCAPTSSTTTCCTSAS